MEEFVQDIKSGMSCKEMEKKYNVSRTILDARRKEYEAVHGKIKKGYRKASQEPRANTIKKASLKQIWAEYLKGVPIVELASRYKMSQKILQENLNQYRDLLMTKAFLKGKSIGELARENGLQIMDVKAIVKSGLNKCIQKIPIQEYLPIYLREKRKQKLEGNTTEQVYRNAILAYESKKKQEKQNVATRKEMDIER